MNMTGDNPQSATTPPPSGGLVIDLRGKRALVTGGNSGIGESIVRMLAGAGADVAINYRLQSGSCRSPLPRSSRPAAPARSLSPPTFPTARRLRRCSSPSTTPGAASTSSSTMPASTAIASMAWEADLDAWRQGRRGQSFRRLLLRARGARAGWCRKSRGVIVNISSVHESHPVEPASAPTPLKGRHVACSPRRWRRKPRRYGVRVLAVAPGAIQTPINKSVWADPNGLC